MKQFVFLLIILLGLSCSNNSHKRMEMKSIESDNIYLEEKEEETSFETLEDAYTVLISEKLQDYLDKQLLTKQHPDFKLTDIKSPLFSSQTAKEIEQVTFIGQPKVISDSITKIITQVRFDTTEMDTIISYIKTATTIIDGLPFKTSKTTFEKIDTSKDNNQD